MKRERIDKNCEMMIWYRRMECTNSDGSVVELKPKSITVIMGNGTKLPLWQLTRSRKKDCFSSYYVEIKRIIKRFQLLDLKRFQIAAEPLRSLWKSNINIEDAIYFLIHLKQPGKVEYLQLRTQ